MKKMRVALSQIKSEIGNPEINLSKMNAVLQNARVHFAAAVCFSELFYSGYDISREEIERLSIVRDGEEISKIKQMAKDANVHLLISYPERDADTEKVYISAMLIDNNGIELLNHRKTYLWGDEQNKVSAAFDYNVCDTVFGKVGVLICYEIEFPEPARILAMKGAEIIFVTAAFGMTDQMQKYLSAIAIQNQCWVVAVNDVRNEEPLRGCSCAVNQYGEIIASSEAGKEGVLYCDIDMSNDRRLLAPHYKELKSDTFVKLFETSHKWFKK